MKYQKIFWLEDTPDILGDILRICAQAGVDQASLFSRTTFAPDYETGANEIIQKQEFDLYILDADFPEAASQDWKKHYWDFMQQVSIDTRHLDFLQYFKDKKGDKYGDGYLGRSTNNFAPFFDQFLREKTGKTIVYSISTLAPAVAFHYGLPFYSKAMEKEGIQEHVAQHQNHRHILKYLPHRVPKSLDFLKGWEYGSRFDLVERYLL